MHEMSLSRLAGEFDCGSILANPIGGRKRPPMAAVAFAAVNDGRFQPQASRRVAYSAVIASAVAWPVAAWLSAKAVRVVNSRAWPEMTETGQSAAGMV